MVLRNHPAAPTIGLVLCRVIVPLWVLTGALFKLIEHTPKLLPPKTVLVAGDRLGIDLYLLLGIIIGVEFAAAAAMLFVGRLARPVAIFMLSVFCLVLVGEMAQGNVTSCGCIGSHSPPPWVMLVIDGALLLGVIVLPPRAPTRPAARWRLPAAGAAAAIGIAATAMVILPASRPAVIDPPEPGNGNGSGQSSDGGQQTNTLPALWFSSDVNRWAGTTWADRDPFRFTRPSFSEAPPREYVIFYSRTCDHCQEMFEIDLSDPALARQVTAVEVPYDKSTRRGPGAWWMPPTECDLRELPLGCEWIMTTPLTVRVEGETISCAQEGGHRTCMQLDE